MKKRDHPNYFCVGMPNDNTIGPLITLANLKFITECIHCTIALIILVNCIIALDKDIHKSNICLGYG